MGRRRAKPAPRRGYDWTAEEDALLCREWGEISGDTLSGKLGRSELACLLRAKVLGLPPQTSGRESVKVVAQRLGVTGWALLALLRECGVPPRPLHLVTETQRRQNPKRGVDPLLADELFTLRMQRAVSLHTWDRARGVAYGTAGRLLVRHGFSVSRRGKILRAPEALLDEMHKHGPGPWAHLWRLVLAMPERPCAPWFLALAAWDLAADNSKPEGEQDPALWARWALSLAVEKAAEDLASQISRPGLSRCSAERREERAA